jgi:crossover junction endodeoxyribonuclease RusA
MITLELPWAPSINHCHRLFQGRLILSREVRAYRQHVAAILRASPIKVALGPVAMRLDLYPPDRRRRDCDNVQKVVLDALQQGGAFLDDSQVVWLLTVKKEVMPGGKVVVTMGQEYEDVLL